MLLRVGGVMGCHLLIALSRHSEMETLAAYWVSFNVLPLIEGLVSPELSKPKGVFLGIALVCIERAICILLLCLTLVSLRIIPS